MAIAKEALMQNDWRLGKEVIAPVAKAHISVTDVIVMDAPACFIAKPMFLTKDCFPFSSWEMLSKHLTMTNMSSIPIPGKKLKDKHYYSKKKFFFIYK